MAVDKKLFWSQFIHTEIVFVSVPCFTESPLCFIPDVRYVRHMLVCRAEVIKDQVCHVMAVVLYSQEALAL